MDGDSEVLRTTAGKDFSTLSLLWTSAFYLGND